MNKKASRSQMLAVRAAMSKAEILAISQVIQDKVISYLEHLQAQNVHVYTSIAKYNEVASDQIIKYLQQRNSASSVHTFKRINKKWQNVSVLSDSIMVGFLKYDVIIVPMLAYDKHMNRLGYGSGFYDRFLASQENAKKLGVCFGENILEIILIESHDIKMDKVFTEKTKC